MHHECNTDKAAGMANEAAGKVKQGIGKAVGSEKLQGEGAAQEVKGDAQQLKGDAKNAVKDGVNKVATRLIRSFDLPGRRSAHAVLPSAPEAKAAT
jgi:uncharacterized protein YjbJ (UPF0337 family)